MTQFLVNIYMIVDEKWSKKKSRNKFLQIHGRHHIWGEATPYNMTCGMGRCLTKKTKTSTMF